MVSHKIFYSIRLNCFFYGSCSYKKFPPAEQCEASKLRKRNLNLNNVVCRLLTQKLGGFKMNHGHHNVFHARPKRNFTGVVKLTIGKTRPLQ